MIHWHMQLNVSVCQSLLMTGNSMCYGAFRFWCNWIQVQFWQLNEGKAVVKYQCLSNCSVRGFENRNQNWRGIWPWNNVFHFFLDRYRTLLHFFFWFLGRVFSNREVSGWPACKTKFSSSIFTVLYLSSLAKPYVAAQYLRLRIMES